MAVDAMSADVTESTDRPPIFRILPRRRMRSGVSDTSSPGSVRQLDSRRQRHLRSERQLHTHAQRRRPCIRRVAGVDWPAAHLPASIDPMGKAMVARTFQYEVNWSICPQRIGIIVAAVLVLTSLDRGRR